MMCYGMKLKLNKNTMVTLHKKECTITNGILLPKMFIHKLKALKDIPGFKKDSEMECYVTEMDKRFAVFSASGATKSFYKVFSKTELHESFQESNA